MNWYRSSQADSYMDKIESGDMNSAIEMVKNAAFSKGYTVLAHHGTRKFEGHKFNRDFSSQGVFWFSDSKEEIEKGESGASGFSTVMSFFLNVGKTAGWKEYEKYSLWEIEQMRFDSIHLDTSWVIFKPERIKLASATTRDNAGKIIDISKRFDLGKSDIRY